MVRGDLKVRIPNPHQGDISSSLIKRILQQAGVSEEAFDKA